MVLRIFQHWTLSMLLALTALPAGAATDTGWFFRAWQTEDGLPEHTIVGLEQTRDGYLWIATHEGLFRFDGVRFQEFAPARLAGMAGSQMRVLLRDHRGQLWLARDGGTVVCVADGEVAQVVNLKSGLSRQQPRCLVEDAQGAIWASDNGDQVYRIRDGRVEAFVTVAGLTNSQCRLAVDNHGQLWFAQADRVGIFRDGAFLTLFKLGQTVARLAGAREGGMWICSGSSLYRYTAGGAPEELAQLKLEAGRSEVEVTVLYEDHTHGLWIGTGSGGLLRYDSRHLQTVDAGLPSITAITEDTEGDLWVGARGAGLNRFRPRAAEVMNVNSGLPFVAVQSACEDMAGTLWLAGQNGTLVCRTNNLWRMVAADSGWKGGSVTCLAADPNGGILIGTREAGVFQEHLGEFGPLPGAGELENSFIRSLYLCTNGDLWIGPDAGGTLKRYRNGRVRSFALPPGSKNVRTIVAGTASDLWAATSDGRLLHLQGDELTDASSSARNTAHKGIRCLHVTSDGSLWIGYSGQGLGWLKNGRYFDFGRTQGMWDDYISQIMADDSDRLWIAGNRGIFQVARSELEAVALGRAARLRSVVLGRGDGLPNLEATFGVWPNSVRCRDGRLLFPMQTGLAVVQSDLIGKDAPPPPVKIETVRVNGRLAAAYDLSGPADNDGDLAPVNLHTAPVRLRFSPGVVQLDFEFAALSLASPENVAFRYQLEGVDHDWVEAGTARAAHYTDLAPGPYRFRVTACGHDGIWSEAGDSIALNVGFYLWERTWFRILGAAAAATLFAVTVQLLVRRRYHRKIERLEQRQALERERTRIAQDLHDDLGAGLVEINLGSELAQDPLLTPEEMREQTREIATRAREMVTALDEIVWAVNPKHDTVSSLASYFCQFAQHFLAATPVRCQLEVARNLPPAPLNAEERHSLFLAFKEALCNLVQHSGATEARLAIAAPEGMLLVALRDNGRGMDLQAPRSRSGADGLDNMRRRLEKLGGHCELVSAPGQGMKVTFTVPLEHRPHPIHAVDNPIEVL